MKTTVDIPDALLDRARRYARKRGRPVRSLIEDGLRLVLEAESSTPPFSLPDRSVGRKGGPNPLENMTWSDLRETIYGGR